MLNKPYSLFFFVIYLLSANTLIGQVNAKFGDVAPGQFKLKSYSVDTGAAAVYLFDVGSCYYVGNSVNNLSLVYTRHARIHLLNKKSFDLATVEIGLYQEGIYREELENLKATTYNIQNGHVEATDIDKNAIFKDKNGNISIIKFTFPAIKEGSIIEFSYKITTPSFQSIRPWFFQGTYPKLWSEYKVSIPDFYDFAILKEGYHPFVIDTINLSFDHYIFNTNSIQTSTANYTWAVENIPGLKEEAFTAALSNHLSRIEFQLATIKYPNTPVKPVLQNWSEAGNDLMTNENFGSSLKHNNNWLNDDIKTITAGTNNNLEKAKKIFGYIRDKFVCTGKNAVSLSQPLKQTYQSGKGYISDINILLATMLKNAGIEVHPVLLSTRKHGKTYDAYPILNKYNYVITEAIIDGKTYLLDASDHVTGFNSLPGECYNGYARVISEKPSVIDLSADILSEVKQTTVFITNSEKEIDASVSTTFGNIESQSIRSKLKVVKENEFLKEFINTTSPGIEFNNTEIDSLNIPEEPITVRYDLTFSTGEEKIIYFDPVLVKSYNENPFKESGRLYPIEMPYCTDNIYILNMEVPKGYSVEEMPASAKVILNDNEGMFEYIIGNSNGRIQIRTRIKLMKANFDADHYSSLKEFFAFIIKKQNEQIVLRKQ